jgi:hypothetical protein
LLTAAQSSYPNKHLYLSQCYKEIFSFWKRKYLNFDPVDRIFLSLNTIVRHVGFCFTCFIWNHHFKPKKVLHLKNLLLFPFVFSLVLWKSWYFTILELVCITFHFIPKPYLQCDIINEQRRQFVEETKRLTRINVRKNNN